MHTYRESNEFRFHLFELKSTVGRFRKLNLKSTLRSWKHSNRLPLHRHLPCDYNRLNPEMVLKKSYCLVQANILRALMTHVSSEGKTERERDRDRKAAQNSMQFNEGGGKCLPQTAERKAGLFMRKREGQVGIGQTLHKIPQKPDVARAQQCCHYTRPKTFN